MKARNDSQQLDLMTMGGVSMLQETQDNLGYVYGGPEGKGTTLYRTDKNGNKIAKGVRFAVGKKADLEARTGLKGDALAELVLDTKVEGWDRVRKELVSLESGRYGLRSIEETVHPKTGLKTKVIKIDEIPFKTVTAEMIMHAFDKTRAEAEAILEKLEADREAKRRSIEVKSEVKPAGEIADEPEDQANALDASKADTSKAEEPKPDTTGVQPETTPMTDEELEKLTAPVVS